MAIAQDDLYERLSEAESVFEASRAATRLLEVRASIGQSILKGWDADDLGVPPKRRCATPSSRTGTWTDRWLTLLAASARRRSQGRDDDRPIAWDQREEGARMTDRELDARIAAQHNVINTVDAARTAISVCALPRPDDVRRLLALQDAVGDLSASLSHGHESVPARLSVICTVSRSRWPACRMAAPRRPRSRAA
jgi:hypothetical protein